MGKKVAILGSGFIGRFYAESLHGQRNRDRVTVVYARREETATQFAADFGIPVWTTDMEEAIKHPETEVVVVALPNHLHKDAVLLCAKHNKAVLCTNPLGRNAAEAKEMLEAV